MADQKQQGTFIVHIVSCQDATWHGSVKWLEENRTQNFRSTLELLKMIDEVVDSEDRASFHTE